MKQFYFSKNKIGLLCLLIGFLILLNNLFSHNSQIFVNFNRPELYKDLLINEQKLINEDKKNLFGECTAKHDENVEMHDKNPKNSNILILPKQITFHFNDKNWDFECLNNAIKVEKNLESYAKKIGNQYSEIELLYIKDLCDGQTRHDEYIDQYYWKLNIPQKEKLGELEIFLDNNVLNLQRYKTHHFVKSETKKQFCDFASIGNKVVFIGQNTMYLSLSAKSRFDYFIDLSLSRLSIADIINVNTARVRKKNTLSLFLIAVFVIVGGWLLVARSDD